MSDCIHINLIKQVGPMDGGEKSKRYRCGECSEFFIVEPDIVRVHQGKPPAIEGQK